MSRIDTSGKSNALIECVPNFSEGRNADTIEALRTAVLRVKDVALLDHHVDADHNRCVLTFVGSPVDIGEAAFRAVKTAIERIDLRKHEGEHPKIGAADVVPFVPLRGASMEQCVQLARKVAERIGCELRIPVFLYDAACQVSERRELQTIRRGGLHGLASRMKTDPCWKPDYGPAELHPTAGAVVVGARKLLIAYNVVLATADLAIARAIAKRIRASDGGLPAVKAIGIFLKSRELAQVSMNLTDYHQTSVTAAFHAVQTEAARHGVEILESEVVGLVPLDALSQASGEELKLARWNADQILETRLAMHGISAAN